MSGRPTRSPWCPEPTFRAPACPEQGELTATTMRAGSLAESPSNVCLKREVELVKCVSVTVQRGKSQAVPSARPPAARSPSRPCEALSRPGDSSQRIITWYWPCNKIISSSSSSRSSRSSRSSGRPETQTANMILTCLILALVGSPRLCQEGLGGR